MILSDAAIRNRTTVLVLIVLIFLAGAQSYITLPRESEPDVPIPIIQITTTYEGVSPEDVESQVTMKIESELSGLSGLKEIRSSSMEGMSSIVVEFHPNVLIEDAMQRVRDKVELARPEMPDDVEEPVLNEINVAEFPIMMVNIAGPISPKRLKDVAELVEDEIESRVPGVLDVEVLGALEREIRLEVDPDRLAAYGITVTELVGLVPTENVNISAGGLETPGVKFNVRVPAEIENPEDATKLPLAIRDGKTIYLSDVANVVDTFKDRTSYSRMDGSESITLSVRKRIGENIVAIADGVKAVLAEARKLAPKGVTFEITLDKSDDIHMMVADLENNILSGLVLVVAVLILFMGWRTSLIVAFAIPMSMLLSFAVIQLLGYTLNMIVLFSLILALGMLVDNAIVIVENIYRYMQLGYRRLDAAIKGTREVAWPVITSTATTVAAFSPMLFWPGIMGDFMKYLPITLIITLSSSLLVALVISPTVCALLGRARRRDEEKHHPFVAAYRWLLRTTLHNRLVTISLAVALLVGIAMAYGKWFASVELFPNIDPRNGIINLRAPQGTNIRESDRMARLVEQRIQPHRADLKHYTANVGSADQGMSFGESASGPHIANITLNFLEYNDRTRLSEDVLREIRGSLGDLAGVEVKVEGQQEGPPTGGAVVVRIIGKDFQTLAELSEKARRTIENTPGMYNLRSDYEAARPELPFQVDRRRAMLTGVNTTVIGRFLQTSIFGQEVSKYREYNDEYDITVRLPEDQRRGIDNLYRLTVPNSAGKPVPLTSVGDFTYKGGFGTIHRIDQKRAITLTADAEDAFKEQVLKEVEKRLSKLDLPRGYEIRYAGDKEEQEKAMAFLGKRAFPMALLLIVLILVAQFNTLSAPLIIMTTVLLSLIGVLAGLILTGLPFGIIMTGIGVISLAGVVVNNAIVLLDYTRQLQRRGHELIDAAIEAGATRLRPVLLTATTTILGLVPMATGMSFDFHTMSLATKSESSQWWASMAVAVIFGLAFATILTLLVVPTLYVSLHRLARRFGGGGLTKHQEDEALRSPNYEDF